MLCKVVHHPMLGGDGIAPIFRSLQKNCTHAVPGLILAQDAHVVLVHYQPATWAVLSHHRTNRVGQSLL